MASNEGLGSDKLIHDQKNGAVLPPSSPNLSKTGEPVPGGEKSFQASIVSLNGGQDIAKLYKPIHLYDLVDYRDPDVRGGVMRRELLCLQTLSPGLNPRIESVLDVDGKANDALVMRRLEPTDFLDEKIKRNEPVSSDAMIKLASTIAQYHFDPKACPSEKVDLSVFYGNLLQTEERLLLERCKDSPGKTAQAQGWFDTVKAFVHENQAKLDVAGRYLQEPVLGHGDLKSTNIALTSRGDVYVLDVAPYPLWQINTRRMDAAFLYTELKLIGLSQEADIFWNAYGSEYQRRQNETGREYASDRILAGTVSKMDAFAEFYRYVIFYRLTFLGVDPQRAPRCADLLDDVTMRMREMPR